MGFRKPDRFLGAHWAAAFTWGGAPCSDAPVLCPLAIELTSRRLALACLEVGVRFGRLVRGIVARQMTSMPPLKETVCSVRVASLWRRREPLRASAILYLWFLPQVV